MQAKKDPSYIVLQLQCTQEKKQAIHGNNSYNKN